MSSKTDQTLGVIKEKSKQILHGEWPIKLIIYEGEIVGFDEIDRPIIKYRVKRENVEIVIAPAKKIDSKKDLTK